MSRIVRLSLTLLFALMMVIATASAALALNPPNHGANGLCAPPSFPAFGIGVGDSGEPGGLAPWNATYGGGNNVGPLDPVSTTENPCV
jgi:hypothetical protein